MNPGASAGSSLMDSVPSCQVNLGVDLGADTDRPNPLRRANRSLPDDGIIDLIAVEMVVTGQRWVPLTRRERIAAAMQIRAEGGSAALISRRLRVSAREAGRLLAKGRLTS